MPPVLRKHHVSNLKPHSEGTKRRTEMVTVRHTGTHSVNWQRSGQFTLIIVMERGKHFWLTLFTFRQTSYQYDFTLVSHGRGVKVVSPPVQIDREHVCGTSYQISSLVSTIYMLFFSRTKSKDGLTYSVDKLRLKLLRDYDWDKFNHSLETSQ